MVHSAIKTPVPNPKASTNAGDFHKDFEKAYFDPDGVMQHKFKS